ncbi:MAG: chloride channel protein [Spirochaetota bacterium]|nr:chloride channel protein [Spirochaetota bacterium]
MLIVIKNFLYKLLEQIKMAEHSFMVGLAILIGILGGFGSAGVRHLINFFVTLAYGGDSHHMFEMANAMPWYLLILIPAVGGAIVGPIIYFFAKEAKGHGVPEVMEAVVRRDGVIRPRVVLVKAIASSVCIGSGGSTGREGPIVQIGSAIGSVIGQIFKLPANKVKTLVACGAAAGIAATFNAPIAGAIFAVEIILGEFGVTYFSPIVISSVVATVVSHQLSGGDFPTFNVPTSYELLNLLELIPFAILGLIAGFIAVSYIKILYASEDLFDNMKLPDYVKPIIGGLLVGVVGIIFPQVLGTGHDSINTALDFLKQNSVSSNLGGGWFEGLILNFSGWSWYLMLGMVVIKILGTSLTLGSGGSGGIFAPSLFIGAMLGGGFGIIMQNNFPEITGTQGAFPIVTMLVGMGGVVSAATHAPITAILIVFELSNYNYKIILPLMLTSIISTLFARGLKKESIYTLKLVRRGVNIESGREVNVLKSIKVKDVMEHKIAFINSTMKLSDIIDHVVNSSHTCFIVIDDNENILGYFTLHDFKQIMKDFEELKDVIIAKDIISPRILSIKEDDNLNHAMNQFGKWNTDELPVFDQSGNKIIGVLWKNTVINSYNHEIIKSDIADGMARRISTIDQIEPSEVIEGYSLVEIPVPKIFVGKTLIDVNVRAKYSVEIILIKTIENDKENRIFPYGDYLFKDKDKLLIFGENNKIKRTGNL